jgi:hypothetical protein
VNSENGFIGSTFSSENQPLDFGDRKLDTGTAVIADLARGTGPTHYRFLVVAVEENVNGAGGDARTAIHADAFVHNLRDQVAEDLQFYRTSLPAFSFSTRLQWLRWRRNLRHI